MSDVVWAALIAVGGSLATGSVTAFFAYKGASRQADVAIAASKAQSATELAKVAAENDRLRRGHLESDRLLRRDAYRKLILSIEQLDVLTSGLTPPVDRDSLSKWLLESRAAGAEVRLVESEAVRDARRAYGDVINEVGAAYAELTEQGEPVEDAWGVPYVAAHQRLQQTGSALGKAMRDDLAYARDETA